MTKIFSIFVFFLCVLLCPELCSTDPECHANFTKGIILPPLMGNFSKDVEARQLWVF